MTYPGKYDVILFNETSAISKAFEVQIQKNNLITLVQTDKPIYKPGQLGETFFFHFNILRYCTCYYLEDFIFLLTDLS